MNNKNSLRVLIDPEALGALEEMLEAVKANGNFVKITPPKLLSWIVTRFKDELFEKHKEQIIQEHFNSKEYLKDLANKIEGSNDAAVLLTAALEKIKSKTKKENFRKNKGKKQKSLPSQ